MDEWYENLSEIQKLAIDSCEVVEAYVILKHFINHSGKRVRLDTLEDLQRTLYCAKFYFEVGEIDDYRFDKYMSWHVSNFAGFFDGGFHRYVRDKFSEVERDITLVKKVEQIFLRGNLND